MAEEPAQRRLAAILAADVIGYSPLMELGETGTLSLCERPWTLLGTAGVWCMGKWVRIGSISRAAAVIDLATIRNDIGTGS